MTERTQDSSDEEIFRGMKILLQGPATLMKPLIAHGYSNNLIPNWKHVLESGTGADLSTADKSDDEIQSGHAKKQRTGAT
jgi:hypothetical protein